MSLRLPALLVLVLCTGDALAGIKAGNRGCNVESDYDLGLSDRSIVLTRESGVPKAVVMRQGRLFVDGEAIALSPADTRRVAAFEQGARAAMPEAQAIAREATDIAITALSGVAAGLSDDPAAVQAKLAAARVKLDAQLGRKITATRFDGRNLGDGIGETVGELVPVVVGDLVGGALRAALSGNAARFKRLENLDAQIEAQIKPRADRLEAQADRFCQRLVELDRLNAAFEYRLPDGRPLNLLDATPAGGNTQASR